MTLIDSSVWIDHWRHRNIKLAAALEVGRVAAHPFVLGELACGTLPSRASTLRFLEALPRLPAARHEEVMTLVEAGRLWGSGLGWIDVHLLAASVMSGVPLWTLDRQLRHAAERLGVHQEPEAS